MFCANFNKVWQNCNFYCPQIKIKRQSSKTQNYFATGNCKLKLLNTLSNFARYSE